MPEFGKTGNWMLAVWQIEQASAKAVGYLTITHTLLWVRSCLMKRRGFCLNINCHSTPRRSWSSDSAETK